MCEKSIDKALQLNPTASKIIEVGAIYMIIFFLGGSAFMTLEHPSSKERMRPSKIFLIFCPKVIRLNGHKEIQKQTFRT